MNPPTTPLLPVLPWDYCSCDQEVVEFTKLALSSHVELLTARRRDKVQPNGTVAVAALEEAQLSSQPSTSDMNGCNFVTFFFEPPALHMNMVA